MEHKKSITSAVFLVAGTCIGGGMLVLPIVTGIGGFFPSLAVMALCWFAMTASALLLLEANLWMEEGAHVITMAKTLLGSFGKWICWLLYLFICYASTVAYTAGGGQQISSILEYYLNISFSKEMGCLLFVLFFGGVISIGSWFVGRVNTILFSAMVVAYFCLVGMGIDEVKINHLFHSDWSASFIAIPLLLTTFSFQTMVPSLTPYLKRNIKALRIAVIGGTALTFIIYAIWQWLILGIVPVGGEKGLAFALSQGSQPATQFLREHVSSPFIAMIAEYFAFFAIVTSFLGITLGLFDFLADGLKIPKKQVRGKIAIGLLIALPTLFFATQYERVFIIAMDTTGGIGDSIMNGIIPCLMVWRGRYYLNYSDSHQTPGGKPLLVLLICLFGTALVMEILAILGVIPSIYENYDLLKTYT